MTMALLDRAMDIAGQRPLPPDAFDAVQSLFDMAKGAERDLIGQLFEAVIVADAARGD